MGMGYELNWSQLPGDDSHIEVTLTHDLLVLLVANCRMAMQKIWSPAAHGMGERLKGTRQPSPAVRVTRTSAA